MPGRLVIQAVIVAGSIIGSIATARADVIDGTWCNGEGRYFTIKGPIMVLINEMTVRLRLGADASVPVETWKRCDVTS
jgi:hypothetical protein